MRVILGLLLTVVVVASAPLLPNEEKDDQQNLGPFMQLKPKAQKEAFDTYEFRQDMLHVSGSQSDKTRM